MRPDPDPPQVNGAPESREGSLPNVQVSLSVSAGASVDSWSIPSGAVEYEVAENGTILLRILPTGINSSEELGLEPLNQSDLAGDDFGRRTAVTNGDGVPAVSNGDGVTAENETTAAQEGRNTSGTSACVTEPQGVPVEDEKLKGDKDKEIKCEGEEHVTEEKPKVINGAEKRPLSTTETESCAKKAK